MQNPNGTVSRTDIRTTKNNFKGSAENPFVQEALEKLKEIKQEKKKVRKENLLPGLDDLYPESS